MDISVEFLDDVQDTPAGTIVPMNVKYDELVENVKVQLTIRGDIILDDVRKFSLYYKGKKLKNK